MSTEHDPGRQKYTRTERSCDLCRRRKVRCDGLKKPGGRCTNCADFGRECTYEMQPQKRGPREKVVDQLRKQVAFLESKLRTLSVCSLCSQPLKGEALEAGTHYSSSVFPTSAPNSASPDSEQDGEPDSSDDDDPTASISRRFNRLSIDSRYFGSVSHYSLANQAIIAKEQATGQRGLPPRSDHWPMASWEEGLYRQEKTTYVFPDSDLISSLVALYFEQFHATLPILHRPSFERSVANGLHLENPQFAQLLLVVLATGSRFSNDPRVLIDGETTQSAGWDFVAQIPTARRWFDPDLYEVQMYFLMTFYFIGTSRPQACWTFLGLGLRFLLQRGEQRRKREQNTTEELELWNRAFWAYICMDRLVCGTIGRPVGISPEDIDASPLLEVDDQYWDTFVQPPNKPSLYAYLKCYLELCEILATTMRLYGSKRAKALYGWDGRDGEKRGVAALDSSLNKCFDSFPLHLRWDPDRKTSDAFYDQSFVLYLTYHWNRIVASRSSFNEISTQVLQIHRPHINKTNEMAAASLATCTTAARAVIRATDKWVRARHNLLSQAAVSALFVSVLVLLMRTFSSRNSTSADDKALINRGIEIIKVSGGIRQSEARLYKVLTQLVASNTLSRRDNDTAQHPPFTNTWDYSQSTVHGNSPLGLPPNTYIPHEQSSSSLSLSQGVSIEQLLAETEDLSSYSNVNPGMRMEEDFTELWMSVPADFNDLTQWGSYIQQQNPYAGYGPSY
ncbi:Zn(2)-C6 fungal-type domain-containing protein [Mycena indigotica]|uniref:Zn(2)-C6 fungal-type domain-containing protein n=1 Tax=Mycena indigotica TaxID=2126181 RepID=A0A8H6W2F1_9AGAR|nr:Zn(2)-C6 fungal-type domain-containing protein [Mycena indigotica]KAF7299193.1 Zn(2)-C6 fungal-type domain-containing protein [Mycena indigotica]